MHTAPIEEGTILQEEEEEEEEEEVWHLKWPENRGPGGAIYLSYLLLYHIEGNGYFSGTRRLVYLLQYSRI